MSTLIILRLHRKSWHRFQWICEMRLRTGKVDIETLNNEKLANLIKEFET